MKISTAARNAMADAFGALPDAGSPPGYFEIRTGSQPANPAASTTGTLLATCPLSNDSFGAASTGAITAAAITSDTNCDNTGTAGYWRLFNAAGTCIAQGSIATSAADMIVNTTSVVAGGTFAISSCVFTMPES